MSTTLRKSNKPTKSKFSKKKTVLTVMRIINAKGRHERTTVEIKSQHLFELLLDINGNMDDLVEGRSPPTVDPRLFFFSRTRLIEQLEQEHVKEPRDEGLISDIEVACEFIVEDYTHIIEDVRSLTAQGEITWDLLWAILVPNTLVYRWDHIMEQDQILLMRSISIRLRRDMSRYVRVVCDVVHDDGSSFGIAHEYIEIDEYTGVRNICDLDVYPLIHHGERESAYTKAIERARKFVGIRQHMFDTHGPAMYEKSNANWEKKIVKFHTYGRVMVDPSAFRMYETDCSYNRRVYARLDRDNLTDNQRAIFSPVALGFCFGTKTWGGFAIDRLTDITWSEEAFDSLVLGAKHKELIYALIRQHAVRSTSFDDIIPGKGRGLVGLLCGRPGCGKTLTAEAAAELTHSALYVVSAGELGTDPQEVDRNLSRILELAQMWGAVLLLDEAEVFLQARGTADLTRNALVSIFLRQLEYYQGILILTTNLISHFDPAFESRIHFCVHYPDLDKPSRLAIWRTFFQKAFGDPGAMTISEADLDRLATREMNGRQIKNAVSSAQSIALEAGAPLSVAHVDKVLDVVSDWNAAQAQAKISHPPDVGTLLLDVSQDDSTPLLDF
ncbi:hypothetical protein EW026_g4850 [Hermanssonia centrifuga]|uniref:AAA+ ATPase domain-containing protein n=1 Tax=Hermanssonia centrifuga TaxID=98765 RepID=A0A4S4KFY7_9APHY|nr:hypothetical protein EW026_g4850 [Hermanssonia centrifuga]